MQIAKWFKNLVLRYWVIIAGGVVAYVVVNLVISSLVVGTGCTRKGPLRLVDRILIAIF